MLNCVNDQFVGLLRDICESNPDLIKQDLHVVLQDMPVCMRQAFEDEDMDLLKAIAQGYHKDVDSTLFWRKMHQAEDAGLWDGHNKELTL